MALSVSSVRSKAARREIYLRSAAGGSYTRTTTSTTTSPISTAISLVFDLKMMVLCLIFYRKTMMF